MRDLLFEWALLPAGWAQNVLIGIAADGTIARVEADAADRGAGRIAGIALPGLVNLHCHAFQRGMAGLAERRGPAEDSFWTWREVMYRFLQALTPDDVEAIAAYAYMEMLEGGFTAVGEFHYLHHDIDGSAYADLGEMAGRIAAAARETGIGLTLLPSLYTYGGFGRAAPHAGQRRFLNDLDRFLKLMQRSAAIVAALPGANIGVAPHSLRAVSPEDLGEIAASFPSGPLHIHAAEQVREVEDSVAHLGARPVAWLLDHADVDARWCLIHATHMDEQETQRLARSGAVAGLCPLTEASLGDGVFEGAAYLRAGGRFGIGSDSNIQIEAPAELRQLENSQRLKHRARNVMAAQAGQSTGRSLYANAFAGGAQATGRNGNALQAGARADIVVLDCGHPDLAGIAGDTALDVYVFSAGRRLIAGVYAGGVPVVSDGRHHARERISQRYRRVLARLAG